MSKWHMSPCARARVRATARTPADDALTRRTAHQRRELRVCVGPRPRSPPPPRPHRAAKHEQCDRVCDASDMMTTSLDTIMTLNTGVNWRVYVVLERPRVCVCAVCVSICVCVRMFCRHVLSFVNERHNMKVHARHRHRRERYYICNRTMTARVLWPNTAAATLTTATTTTAVTDVREARWVGGVL